MKKILLVEDDKFLLRVYQIKLQKEGYDTVSMQTGLGVGEAVIKEKPDLVLLDLILPNKDGFEVLKELKGNAATKNVPVVVLTALGAAEDKKTCLDLGAAEFVEKNMVSIQEVVEIVGKYSGK